MKLIKFSVTYKENPRIEYQYILSEEKYQNFLQSNKSRILYLTLKDNDLDFETRKFLNENKS